MALMMKILYELELLRYNDNLFINLIRSVNILWSHNLNCPICYSKGIISLDDMKRLNILEIRDWTPNKECTYCLGEGSIKEKTISLIIEDLCKIFKGDYSTIVGDMIFDGEMYYPEG